MGNCSKCNDPVPEGLNRGHPELCAYHYLDTPEGKKLIVDVPTQHLGRQRKRRIKLKPYKQKEAVSF